VYWRAPMNMKEHLLAALRDLKKICLMKISIPGCTDILSHSSLSLHMNITRSILRNWLIGGRSIFAGDKSPAQCLEALRLTDERVGFETTSMT
ncbi:MAG TPA: hypothetical protein VLE49_09545, partial [Anaerolineales bacterium]|nr:hypothetical protein [Anaerolineales bacterium]